jgi:hypothetical protein
VVFASRIKPFTAIGAPTPAIHVFLNAQDMLARSAQYCLFVSLASWPDARIVRFICIVAADAGVELLAAEVLDSDDVQWRVPVCTLGQRSNGQAVHCWR